jgi:hypothetical protein
LSYESKLVGRLFVVLWGETTLADIDRLRREFNDAARQAGGTVIYVSIQDATTKPPADAERKGLMQLAEDMFSKYDSLYLVLRADGFRGSVLRSTVAGMMLMSKQRSKVHVVGTLDEVLYAERDNIGVPESTVRRELANANILFEREQPSGR